MLISQNNAIAQRQMNIVCTLYCLHFIPGECVQGVNHFRQTNNLNLTVVLFCHSPVQSCIICCCYLNKICNIW